MRITAIYFQCKDCSTNLPRSWGRLCLVFCFSIAGPEDALSLGVDATLSNFLFFSYKNGSLTRERIRDSCAAGSWEKFDQLLQASPLGNQGNIGRFGLLVKNLVPFAWSCIGSGTNPGFSPSPRLAQHWRGRFPGSQSSRTHTFHFCWGKQSCK